MPPAPSPAPREVTRLEGFSDAVFGFAITLLVVSLEVPATFDDLIAAFRSLPVFAITFTILLLVWFEHHQFFRKFGPQDGLTIWLNGALLFVVMTYIYPLKFLFTTLTSMNGARSGGAPMIRDGQVVQLMVMYGVGFAAIFGIMALMYLHAARLAARGTLDAGAGGATALDARLGAGHCGVYVLVGVLSIAIAVVGNGPVWTAVSGFTYMAIGPLQMLYHSISERWRRAT